jgi:hypothetical protein
MSMADIRHTQAVTALVADILEKRDAYNRATNSETESVKIFRAQGAIEALDAVLEMIEAEELDEEEPDQLPR